MPAATRRFNSQAAPWSQISLTLGREQIPVQKVFTRRATVTAVTSLRGMAAPLGEQGEAHRGEGFDFAHQPLAAAVGSVSAGAFP